MKRNWIIMMFAAMIATNANALIVNVEGQGEIPAGGMEITLTEAEEDPLTGDMQMAINGTLLSNGALKVAIERSATAIEDEFCCAGLCTGGNGEQKEELTFTPEGIANWFIHYAPAEGSNETITYTFADASETRTLTVHYIYGAQGIENVQGDNVQSTKVIENGVLYLKYNGQLYDLQGQKIQ